tara:strand:- start:2238 stop:3419 length:1182 start_codon:yes stop_codon:yes gene_type:complete
MATHDYILANQSGSSFRSDLNNALAAIVSQNSSATEPATKYAYQYWVDTSATPALIKQRNAANDAWVTLAEVDGQILAADGTNAKPGISFAADIDTGFRRTTSNEVSIVTGGTIGFTVDGSQNVGIGTTNPTQHLHLRGPALSANYHGAVISAQSTERLRLGYRDGGPVTGLTCSQVIGSTNNLHLASRASASGDIVFYAGAPLAEKARLKGSSGSFETGTIFSEASPSSGTPGYKFAAGGSHLVSRNVSGISVVFQAFGTEGSFKTKGDGDAQNTNNSYGGISDATLKENIVDASSQWDDIKAIQIRNYNFREDTNLPTHRQIGVVAQELETVCPGLVKDDVDEDSDGNDLGTTTKSVNYSVLYMKAVKALQEAMTRIETLETKVAALEAAN